MEYTQYSFEIQPKEPWVDILIAELADLNFDTFQESDNGFEAFLPKNLDLPKITLFLNEFSSTHALQLKWVKTTHAAQNWNAQWESSFEPVAIGSFCLIKAPFHQLDASKFQHEIIIMPKMSFGTGHHPTTYLMGEGMSKIEFAGISVLDMGCGTGVLGILAKKMGANEVLGIDIEEWAVENTIENAEKNKVSLSVLLGGKEKIPAQVFQVILANINRNILLDQMELYAKHLSVGGKLLLSGFMIQDKETIEKSALENRLKLVDHQNKENWVCLKLEKV